MSSINDHSRTAAQSLNSHGLERISLDFLTPDSRSGTSRASQSPYHSAGNAHYNYGAENKHLPFLAHDHHVQAQNSGACVIASAEHSPWPSTISTSNYRRPSTIGSNNYTESEFIGTSDHDLPSTNPQSFPSGSSKDGCADTRREPHHAYVEEECASIMVCAILHGMTWQKIEKEFRERFSAGQKRCHQGI